jgi:DNA-3-methyladenine glycosylase II
MAGLIEDFGGPLPLEPELPELPSDLYGSLLRGITGQQLSVTSARAIFGRVEQRYGGRTPTAQELLDDDPDALRVAVGLSHAKTASLRSLAEHVVSGELDLDRLHELPDAEVSRQLIAVKGIGQWTADMFLIFSLHRPDVFAVGDLGIRNAIKRFYGLNGKPAQLVPLGEPWRPYRTRACLYLWRTLTAGAPLQDPDPAR